MEIYEAPEKMDKSEKLRKQRREAMRKFRKRHPNYEGDKKARLAYQERGKMFKFDARRWTPKEIDLIESGEYSDHDLVDMLSRSIGSIQTKRSRIKRGKKDMQKKTKAD